MTLASEVAWRGGGGGANEEGALPSEIAAESASSGHTIRAEEEKLANVVLRVVIYGANMVVCSAIFQPSGIFTMAHGLWTNIYLVAKTLLPWALENVNVCSGTTLSLQAPIEIHGFKPLFSPASDAFGKNGLKFPRNNEYCNRSPNQDFLSFGTGCLATDYRTELHIQFVAFWAKIFRLKFN